MVDPESLLEPVPGDLPEGVDLRNPARKPELADVLAALRTARRRLADLDPGNPPDWVKVEKQCEAILRRHSKDMEAAAFLAEVLAYNDGFAGLAAGGQVIAGLVARWWDTLYPAPDPEEPEIGPDEARLMPLVSLVEEASRLPAAIRQVVLFTLEDGTGFTLSDCQALKAFTALRPEERSTRIPSLSPTHPALRGLSGSSRDWDGVAQAVSGKDDGALAALQQDAAAALAAWQAVADAVQGRVGEGRLSCKPLLDLIGDVERLAGQLAPATAPAPAAADVPQGVGMIETTPAAKAATPAGGPGTREDALRQLTSIAAFFRRSEPHSPVAYTLEEAIRRARLAWPDWLAEIVPDRSERDAILTRLGLRPDPDP